MKINPIFNNVRVNLVGVYEFLEQLFIENEIDLTDEDRKKLVVGYTAFTREEEILDFNNFIKHFDKKDKIYPILYELRSNGCYGMFTNQRRFNPKKLGEVESALLVYYLDNF